MAIRTLTIGIAVAGLLAALVVAAYWGDLSTATPVERKARRGSAGAAAAALYVYPIQRGAAFGGRFGISRVGSELHFDQIYLAEFSGSNKTVKQAPFPEWRFDAGAEPARLESEISVFDNSATGSHEETITIELYDYRPEQPKTGWIESGLKSVNYQNLSGNCAQTDPVPLVSTSN